MPQEREYKYSSAFEKCSDSAGLLKSVGSQTIKAISMKTKRTLWKGINEIIYSKKAHKTNSPSSLLVNNGAITNIPQIAEDFYQYFTSIGKTLQLSILPTKTHFSEY